MKVSLMKPGMSKDFEQTLTNTGWFAEKINEKQT
jgi:hypothetical protein